MNHRPLFRRLLLSVPLTLCAAAGPALFEAALPTSWQTHLACAGTLLALKVDDRRLSQSRRCRKIGKIHFEQLAGCSCLFTDDAHF